ESCAQPFGFFVRDRQPDRLAELHVPLCRKGQRPENPQNWKERRDRDVRHAKELANPLGPTNERVNPFRANYPDRHHPSSEREREPREPWAERAQAVAIAERLRDARDAFGKDHDLLVALEQLERVLARRRHAADATIERVDGPDVGDEAIVEEARDA